jgi:hypothetical protein
MKRAGAWLPEYPQAGIDGSTYVTISRFDMLSPWGREGKLV